MRTSLKLNIGISLLADSSELRFFYAGQLQVTSSLFPSLFKSNLGSGEMRKNGSRPISLNTAARPAFTDKIEVFQPENQSVEIQMHLHYCLNI